MAVTNPFSITYGSRTIGGSSDSYQLLGPYVVEKSFDTIRIVAEVVVVATSFATVQSLSDALEVDFRKRLVDGDTVVISIDGNDWTYTVGSTMLVARAQIAKTGNPETDREFSRGYRIVIEGELPADGTGDDGLRDIEAHVDYTPSRQTIVSFRGTYTADSGGDALANYNSDADTVCGSYLTTIKSTATFELVDETHTLDREGESANPHIVNWTRQYVELLANQSNGVLDDDDIVDHRLTFTDLGQHPGDSALDVHRLRRVVGSFDCGIDITESTDVRGIYTSKVKDFVRQEFVAEFAPVQFGVEEERVSIDRTGSRLSVSLQFIYQPTAGSTIVEVASSVTHRTLRTIDYTPTHSSNENSMFADVGFATKERIRDRTVIAVGEQPPELTDNPPPSAFGNRRITRGRGAGGVQTSNSGGTGGVNASGWNVIAETSRATPRWIGDPSFGEQIPVVVTTENVIERYSERPGGNARPPG